jgi:hypothetical protein
LCEISRAITLRVLLELFRCSGTRHQAMILQETAQCLGATLHEMHPW